MFIFDVVIVKIVKPRNGLDLSDEINKLWGRAFVLWRTKKEGVFMRKVSWYNPFLCVVLHKYSLFF